MLAQPLKSLIHVDAVAFSDDSLGLLDEDSAVEGTLELFVRRSVFSGCTFVEKADRCDVCEGLADGRVFITQHACLCSKQVECPDCARQFIDSI